MCRLCVLRGTVINSSGVTLPKLALPYRPASASARLRLTRRAAAGHVLYMDTPYHAMTGSMGPLSRKKRARTLMGRPRENDITQVGISMAGIIFNIPATRIRTGNWQSGTAPKYLSGSPGSYADPGIVPGPLTLRRCGAQGGAAQGPLRRGGAGKGGEHGGSPGLQVTRHAWL